MHPDLPLVLIGDGEHAAVVREAAELAGWRVQRPSWGIVPALPADPGNPGGGIRRHIAFLVAPGSPRRRDFLRVQAWEPWATIVHPGAFLSRLAVVGNGAFVGVGSIVGPYAIVGPHAVVNSGAIVEHHCTLGIGVHVAPGAVLGGGCTVGDWAWIGLGARVRDHVTIGKGAIVGMGAVVVADVPAGQMVVGCPARPMAEVKAATC